MRTSGHLVLGIAALLFVFDSPAFAEQNKPKKAKQTQDRGIDDDDRAIVPDKNAAGAHVIHHPDGSISSILDESFLEAMVAVKNADGTISYRCFHGLPAASDHVTGATNNEAAATKPVTKLEVK